MEQTRPRLLCIACRHGFNAYGAAALSCPNCGSSSIRAMEGAHRGDLAGSRSMDEA